MKLRINAKLRAALIAAITAVGFTLTQAQAEAVQLSGVTPTALNSSTAGNSGLDWTDATGNLTSWRLTFTLKETRDSVADNVLLGTNGNGTSSAGGDMLKILSNGSFMLEAGGSSITTSAGEIQSGGTATVVLEYIADYNQYDVSLNKGTYNLTVNDGEVKSLVVSDDNNTNFLKGTNSNTRLWTNTKKEWYSDITLWQLDNNIIEVTASQWKGQSGANEWVSSNFQPEFSTGKDVVFDATGYNTVVVKDAVQAGEVTVSDTDYTFDIQSGGTLSAKSINVGDGASAKLTGAGTYALASGVISLGDVTLDTGWTGVVRITDAQFVNNLANINNMKNADSWVMLKGTSGWSANNTFNANLILENGTNGWAFAQNDGNNGHALNFTGKIKGTGKLGRSNDKGSTYTYAFSGDISEWTGTFESRSMSNHSTTFRVSDNATAVNAALVNAAGNLNVDVQTSATFGAGVDATLLTVASGKTATFNGTTTLGNVTLASDATLVNAGAMTINGTITFGASAIANNGTGTISFGDGIHFDLTGMTAVNNVYTLFNGTGADIDLSGYNTSYITVAGGTAGKTWTFNNDGTISYTQSTQKVWTGEVGDWDYESANWNGDELFTSDSVAVFNGEAMVTVKGDVEAEAIDLQNGAWVMLGGDTVAPASLTAGSLDLASGSDLMSFIAIDGLERFTVAEGAAWTIGEAQELGAGTNSGTITVLEDATARLTNASNAADLLLGIVGAGNISLGQNVTIASGEEASMPATKATGTLIIEEGVKLQVGNNKDKYASIASFTGVEMKQGASIDTQARLVEINNLEVTTDDSHTNTIKLLDTYDSAAEIVGLDLKGTTALNGNLKITGDWKYKVNIEKLTGAYSEQDGYSGKLTLTGDKQTHNAVIGEMNIDTLTVENMNLVQLKGVTSLKTLSVKTGDMEIVSAASVSSLLDLSVAGASNAKLTVKNGGVLTVGPDAALWGRSASSILLEEESIMNLAGMKIVGGTDGGAVVGTESGNAQYGVDSSDWYIYNADITATKAITVGNELSLSSINTGEYAVELTNSNNMLSSVTVGEGGSFSMTGGELLSVIDNAGEVTLTSISLNDEIFVEEGGAEGAHYGLDGKATEGANYYLGTTDKYVTVVDGGTSATGSGITWGTTTGLTMTDGKIVTQAGEVAYETFYVNADSVDVSTITNPGTTGVEVAGGTLNVDRETALNITVTGEGTITGDKADAKQVGIAADATAYYTGAVEDSGVKFTPGDEIGAVIISNNGEAAKAYSTTDKDLSVTAQKLEMTKQDGDVTVSNAIVVDELVNTTGKVLTLDNAEALLLVDMNITGSTVELSYINGDQQVAEGIVSLAGILQGGDATLKADLTLYGGSTLDVDGGDPHALTLGSTLTVDYASGLINLDDATLSALNAMNIGDTLKLIVAADQTTLGYGGESSYDGMWYDEMFNRAGTPGVSLQGDFTVYAQGDAFGLTKVSNVPEPTTGTLSLLALMALAARRRRK